MMSKPNRTINQSVFLGVFIIAGIFNASYGQTKADKIDKLIRTYTEYGKFNGAVLAAEKGKVIYKKGTWLPDYPKKNGDIITIHHLLTHSSGIPNMTSFPGFFKNISRNSYSPVQLVNLLVTKHISTGGGYYYGYGWGIGKIPLGNTALTMAKL